MSDRLYIPEHDLFTWDVRSQVIKYECMEALLRGGTPYEVLEGEGNLFLNAGIQRMLDKFIGAAGQVLDNTHARIGTSDGSTAVVATDTDLSGAAGSTHRWFQVMDATFPSRAAQTLSWQATFAAADGNYAWADWGIDAGTASGNTVTAPLINRKVQSWGTKVSPAVWIFLVTTTLS